jgi:hypothetical protein
MADVMQKAIIANDIRNGSALAGVDKKGNKQVLVPSINIVPTAASVEAEYTNRFDDVSYYG